MRPTDLKFRSPREKTPDPYDAHVTAYGARLFECRRKAKSTFSTAKRFQDPSSDRIGYWRGPGSYDLTYESIGKKKIKGVHVYKPFHGGKDLTNNAYYYIGNNLVYDPSIILGKSKSKYSGIDGGLGNKSRPTTASSKNYSPLVRKFMTPQPNDEYAQRPASALGFRNK